MTTILHKLSNVVLRLDGRVDAYPEMLFRSGGAPTTYSSEAQGLVVDKALDFLTYFGSCSLAKWKRYTGISTVELHLALSNEPCDVILTGISDGDAAPRELARIPHNQLQHASDSPLLSRDSSSQACDSSSQAEVSSQQATNSPSLVSDSPLQVEDSALHPDDAKVYAIPFPETSCDIIGFTLVPHTHDAAPTTLLAAAYFTRVDASCINPVHLALSTTTFCKESYIIPNIELVKREILGSCDPIAQHFHMFVVDNGRTLDASALSGGGVTVIPNANAGGAGGFARGMMAALDASDDAAVAQGHAFTHILLMDDDVIISSESIKRTFNLLSLTQEPYRNAFINGAMLTVEEPRLQTEDVARVLKTGGYCEVKPRLHVDELGDIVRNEAISVEVENAYGAWWYCCIPLDAIRAHGLPLPLFVRCDDVEFGMRTRATYMTMNGICVWHEGFGGRFRPSVDCYQFIRNFLIMNAVNDVSSEDIFMTRELRIMRLHLRTMAYDVVEAFLAGIEDYLKGPEFIAQVQGDVLMRENSRYNEPLQALETLDADIVSQLDTSPLARYSDTRDSRMLRLWCTLPYDKHLLPEVLMHNTPSVIRYNIPIARTPRACGAKTLVACDVDGTHAHVRHLDKQRWRAIKKRWKRVMAHYRKERHAVRARYKEALPHLTSRAFWDDYLATRLALAQEH